MKIQVISGGILNVNTYLLMDEQAGCCAVIDPGAPQAQIIEAIDQSRCKVEYILLTHAHFDHVWSLHALKQHTGAQIVMMQGEQDIAADPSLSGSFGMDLSQLTFSADRIVSENDQLPLGNMKLCFLHTPGHRPGCMCILAQDALFSGDTLFAGSIGRTDLPGGSYTAMQHSLQKLRQLSGDYRVFPGHGPLTTLAKEKAENPYLEGNSDAYFD